MSTLSEKDLLKFAVENGMIDLDTVQQQVKMNERQKCLKKHPYKIWEGKDGKWRTYLPDETKETNRRLIKRNTEESIKETIISYYMQNDENSFKNIFSRWEKRQSNLGVDGNTIVKYDSDYKRFIEGTAIEYKSIDKISEDDLIELLREKTEKLKIPYKSLQQAYWMIRSVFDLAYREKIIAANICHYITIKLLKKFCVEREKTPEKRVFSEEELVKLYLKLEDDHLRSPMYITPYAVQFSMFTGLRVSEIAALKWSKIDYQNKRITIDSYEKRNRQANEYEIVNTTKTHKIRIIPLTSEIEDFLNRVRKEEMKYGFLTEYVFSDEKGRIHFTRISDCALDKARQAGIKFSKGTHALRRTLNSNLKESGVSTSVASSILGHTDEVNISHYSYDTTQMDYKNKMMSRVHNGMLKDVMDYQKSKKISV